MTRRRKRKRSSKRQGDKPQPELKKIQIPAGIYLDHTRRQIVSTTRDMLWNQLKRDTPEIERSFDALCEDDITALSGLFGESAAICMAGMSVTKDTDDRLRNTCAIVMMNSFGYFVSALQLLRAGHRLQPPTMIRSVVECLSVVLHLIVKPSDFDEFEAGNVKSTKAVTTAKKVLPYIGELYGQLSSDFTHIRQFHQQPHPLTSYSDIDDAVTVNLMMLRLSCWLIYVTLELLFYDVVEESRYWEHRGKNEFAFNPPEGEREWMKKFFDQEDLEEVI
ncbi:MAG: hypothetical protein U5R46_08625 [Gammaproteobacteria bacterium]|nr:hypothetical protein [Gammaproteobacteria bacterium]